MPARYPLLVSRRAIAGMAAIVLALASRAASGQSQPLPTRLTDAEFWRMVTTMSEPGGTFPSENFTSNEMGFPAIVAHMRAAADTGGAYLGVGPEQNFSYIAGVRPRIAFLVDIRRQSVIQHLMYKAIFELSSDRADFVSMLFSKPRPSGLAPTASITDIWAAYWTVATDSVLYQRNETRIIEHLRGTHGFTLDSADLATLRTVYHAFYINGPKINYSSRSDGAVGTLPFTIVRISSGSMVYNGIGSVGGVSSGTVMGGGTPRYSPAISGVYGGVNFAAVTAALDDDSIPRSFLATDSAYRYMKELHSRNLFVPLVGDFAGPRAIRGVGQWLRDHGTTLTAFYVSNVEDYLFRNNVWRAFYDNVATIPVTASSVFIRGGATTCPIEGFLAAVAAGRVSLTRDAASCVR